MRYILALLLTCAAFSVAGQEKKPVQCKGITVKGVQCSNQVKEGEYCYIHNPATPRCGVKTTKGAPCKNIVKSKELTCGRHIGREKMQPVSTQ